MGFFSSVSFSLCKFVVNGKTRLEYLINCVYLQIAKNCMEIWFYPPMVKTGSQTYPFIKDRPNSYFAYFFFSDIFVYILIFSK